MSQLPSLLGERGCCPSSGGLVICWLLLPLVIAWLITTMGFARLFYPRYLLASAAAPIVFAGLCLSRSPRGVVQNILLAIVLAISLFASGVLQRFAQDQRFLHDRNQDWRGVAQFIESSAQASERLLLVRSGFLEADRLPEDASSLLHGYCLAPVSSLYRLVDELSELIPLTTSQPWRLSDTTLQSVIRHQGATCVINGSRRSHANFEAKFTATLEQQQVSVRLRRRRTFGEVLVVDYEVVLPRP